MATLLEIVKNTDYGKWNFFFEAHMDVIEKISFYLEEREKEGEIICPGKENIFRMFLDSDPDNIVVLILGQDPYHTLEDGEPIAIGRSFAVKDGANIPPSLNNIFKEITDEYVGKRETKLKELKSLEKLMLMKKQMLELAEKYPQVRKSKHVKDYLENNPTEDDFEIFSQLIINRVENRKSLNKLLAKYPKIKSLDDIKTKKEKVRLIDYQRPENGTLDNWIAQGVFMLNTALSVKSGAAESHLKVGFWEMFIRPLMKVIYERNPQCIFVLWGKKSKDAFEQFRINDSAITLLASHPSPLSAYRGFFGCGHFLEINKKLKKMNKVQIKW